MALQPSPAVLRACDVISELSRQPALSASELARRIDAPRATCHAVLLALADRGFVVRREEDLRYELGPACIPVGDAARGAVPIDRELALEAERLARATSSCVAVVACGNGELRATHVSDFAGPHGL